jgi:3D (Asp-Asp-Asp) domain-containing protein
MKLLSTCLSRNSSAILAVAILCLMAFQAGAQSRETSWTSVDGVTIWARVTGMQGSTVLLVMRGREYRVPLERLTPESVRKARRLLDLPETKSTAARPTFADAGPALPARPAAHSGATSSRDKHGMPVYPFSETRRIVRTTAYSCGESDHLIYGSRNALGTALQCSERIRSAAADWSVYPVGTTFSIKGLPYLYVVDDYGSALTGTGTIDIYQPTLDCMRKWGRRNVELTVIRWGSLTRSAEILSQRQSHSHCREMLANILRQRPQLACMTAR